MENLPVYISIVFAFTTALTVLIFYFATNKSTRILMIILAWLAIQSVIALSGFYKITNTVPPRFMLLVAPALVVIAWLFISKKGRQFLRNLDTRFLTLLHVVRIPVEVILFCLFLYKQIPQLMTFEGRNFDIIAGITAPVIFYYGFVKSRLNKLILLLWNIVSIGLLANIVINAILSLPSPFQRFAFEQPNVAILFFPFIWLPCFIVPAVLLSHLTVIMQLLYTKRIIFNNDYSKQVYATKLKRYNIN